MATSTNTPPTELTKKDLSAPSSPEQSRLLSALAVSGIESILREVSEGEIDNQKALEKIQALLNEHGKKPSLGLS